jgi:hypothetical protein
MISRERSFFFSPALFQYASEEMQIETAASFISRISHLCSYDYQNEYSCKCLKNVLSGSMGLDRSLLQAIAAFDYCLADEIRVYEGSFPLWTDKAAVYYRSDSHKAWYPAEVIKRATGKEKFIVGTPQQLSTDKFKGISGMLTPDIAFGVVEENFGDLPQLICCLPRQAVYGVHPKILKVF